ncbi:MAG: hypothetical protein AAF125_23400, partial [Chloroflexota bacterium]
MRLRLIDGHFPVLENRDEIARMLHAMRERPDRPELAEAYGIFVFNPGYDYTGFPPLQLWTHAWLQRSLEAASTFPPVPGDYIIAGRYLGMGLSMLTLGLMIWMGYEIARPLGRPAMYLSGWLAGLVWAISPVVIAVTNLALADPLIFHLIPLGVIGMIYAVRGGHVIGAFASLLCAIIAIYAKYSLVYLLVFPAVAVGGIIWYHGEDGSPFTRLWHGLRKNMMWITIMAIISAGTAGWLIWGNQALALENRETREFYNNGLANAISLDTNLNNILDIIMRGTGYIGFFLVVAIGIVAAVTRRRRGQPSLENWLIVTLLVFV